MTTPNVGRLLKENEELRHRLEEAEQALRALSAGEVDAVLIDTGREQIFTLDAADKPYWLLVAQVPHPAATLTAGGTIISCNNRFADLLQQPHQTLPGKPIQGFVAAAGRPALETLLRDGLAAEVQAEVPLQRADGTPKAAFLSVRPLREGVHRQCLMITDFTEQQHYQELKRTQEALRASEERLDLSQRAGRVGTFEWNIKTGEMHWSAANEELYGLPVGGFGGRYEDWTQAVHPDDRERAEADHRRAVAERAELNTEFRIVRPDRGTSWIACKGRVLCTAEGEPVRMLGVCQDVSERKRSEEELRSADRKKDEFLATLAHELRNALAPIRNAAQVLNAKGPLHPELVWARGVIDRQAKLMARLLDDLLDVSRISLKKVELRTELAELAAVCETALETSRPVIQAARHELAVSLPSEPVLLRADTMRLAQVLANLLNNAARYTEEGGRIRLSAEVQGADVMVSVRDSGIGIAPDLLPSIFEIFSQVKPTASRSQSGLGIGLSLVKGLVELHGGSVEAHSEGLGRGSEFIVRLPVASETSVREPSRPSDDDEKPPTRCRILIVDDNRDGADSLAMLLELMGNQVATAYDGEQALEAAEAFRPDVVLLDLGMPKLSGYDVCRRIRAQSWGQGVVLIALTGWGQEADRRRSEEAGFDRHMVKPVDPGALMRLLGSFLPGRGGRLGVRNG